jgi:hypothetical protein
VQLFSGLVSAFGFLQIVLSFSWDIFSAETRTIDIV